MRKESRQADDLPEIEITAAMIRAGRDTLLASFPEDVLSERTAGLDRAVCDIFQAMQERSEQFSETALVKLERLTVTPLDAGVRISIEGLVQLPKERLQDAEVHERERQAAVDQLEVLFPKLVPLLYVRHMKW
jgi:hypothetical protein